MDHSQRNVFACNIDESAGYSVKVPDEPTDDEIYNRVTGPHTGVEGGIAYDTSMDEPGSLGENDWRL
jgi:hypothetical protein